MEAEEKYEDESAKYKSSNYANSATKKYLTDRFSNDANERVSKPMAYQDH